MRRRTFLCVAALRAMMKINRWSLVMLTCVVLVLAILASSFAFSDRVVQDKSDPSPPIAKRIPHNRVVHGETFVDDYDWFREGLPNPDVKAYVEDENSYTDNMMASTKDVQEYFKKKIGDIYYSNQDDGRDHYLLESWQSGDFLYYTRYKDDADFPFYYRRRLRGAPYTTDSGSLSSVVDVAEELVLDTNEFARGKAYFALGVFEPSPSQSLLAFSFDEVGNERFIVHFKNLTSGELIRDAVLNDTYYSLRWTSDSRAVVFNRLDALIVPRYVYLFKIFEAQAPQVNPQLLYEERDEAFTATVDMTNDHSFILIQSVGQVTSEIRLLDAASVGQLPPRLVLVAARKSNVMYTIEHNSGAFYVRTNDGAKNYKVMKAATINDLADPTRWTTVVEHNATRFLVRLECFETALVVWYFAHGLKNFLVYDLARRTITLDPALKLARDVYALFPGTINDEESRLYRSFYATTIAFSNSSYVMPRAVYSFELQTGAISLLVVENYTRYDATKYCERRVMVPSTQAGEGNVKIPVSILFAADGPCSSVVLEGARRPLYLHGYGAYGGMIETSFDVTMFAIVDEGFIYGYAHVRGDGDLGADWYWDGKYEKKMNTVRDFVAVLTFFVERGYTTEKLTAITGRSAGGLLAGGTLNVAAGLVQAGIVQVPFVDVIGDMVNETMAWVAFEWYEWGNPLNSTSIYRAMKEYSPYDNVRAQNYPDMLYIGGLNDPRVQFYEPLKMVASLRSKKTDKNMLLMRSYDKGHFSASGGDQISELSFINAFIFKSLRLTPKSDAFVVVVSSVYFLVIAGIVAFLLFSLPMVLFSVCFISAVYGMRSRYFSVTLPRSKLSKRCPAF